MVCGKEGERETRHGAISGSCGHRTSALGARGAATAAAVQAAVRNIPMGLVVSDPLTRMKEETEKCCCTTGATVQHVSLLRQLHKGRGAPACKNEELKDPKELQLQSDYEIARPAPPSAVTGLCHIKEAERKLKGIERHGGAEALRCTET
ncbi:hypothetical protein NDU88_007382 [Pleurodeles waltl]|uniref:Uncharacterized protein n=1 Tax=Pleurodeles waltl TaxID=8319 RepID=A0AAV7N673_PLEWA|nr:hypothetical protein NDU88_007382 [Pleurodeles waltl]